MTDRPRIDFARIKREVSVLDVARRYGVDLKGKMPWLSGKCPLPTHESKDSKSSFSVNVKDNYWKCWSDSCNKNRGNKRGGDIITLVRLMEQLSDAYDAARLLADWYHVNGNGNGNGSAPKAAPEKKPEPQKAEASLVNVPLKFQTGFKEVDYSHEYLLKRGIKPDTAKDFGVGFYAGKSTVIKDPYRIVIPVRNEQGELVAYVGRSLDPNEKDKYHFPAGFHKSLALFNLHRVTGDQVDAVLVVEGFFGAMKIWQAGFQNVVALMGCTMSEAQEKLLERFKTIVLMLDPDEPGREAAKELAPRLAANHFVRSVNLPDGKQPDTLSSAEIQSILRPIL